MIAWKAFPASNWLWKHFSLQKFVLMLERNGSQLARGQVNMADEAKLRSPIRSTFELLIVWHVGGHCLGEELGPFYWPLLLEKAMASHSSTHAWKIPWTGEPERLQSMGSLRVGHDWATSVSLFTFMHWIRKWQPTPVFLPGESQGRGSLVGCCLWGRTESDTTEVT